jgi:hypothetical protein
MFKLDMLNYLNLEVSVCDYVKLVGRQSVPQQIIITDAHLHISPPIG